jgi:type I restriction enzyme S subunit
MADIINSEIGAHPADWSIQRVDSLFDIQQGKSVSKAHRKGDNQKPFLRTKNIFWGQIDTTELDQMHFTSAEEARLKLQVGDLLLCEGGDVGRTAIWNDQTESCYYQNHLHRLRAKAVNEVDPQFALYWFWYAFEVANIYIGRSNVTTIPNLSQSKLSELQIPKPEFEEQHRIAHVLSTVQTSIEQQARLIALTREIKSALMRKLFTEGLHGEKQKETEIGLVPESWEMSILREFANEITDFTANGSFASLRENVEYMDKEDYAILLRLLDHSNKFSKDFVYVNKHAYDFLKKSWLMPGSVIVSNIGARLGTVFRAPNLAKPMTLGPNALVVRAGEDDDFVYYWLQSEQAQKYIKFITSISAQPKFNKTDFRNTPVPIPNKNERDEIANILSQIDYKIYLEQSRLEKYSELFRSLLHQLMTGQIRVNEVDLPDLS